MRKKTGHTLVDQLIGRQVGLLAILLFVVGVSQYLILRAVLLSSTARTLRDEVYVLAPVIHHGMASKGIAGFKHIADILVSRLRAPQVEVVITNALSHVVVSSQTLHAKIPPLYNMPYFIWNHRIVVNAVIGNRFYPSGYVWLLSSIHPIHNILQRDAELYVFLALLSLIIAGWLGSLSVRQTLHPLQQIRESTQRIASGEFGHTTHIENAPMELQDLSQAIDRMSESIQGLFAQEKALSQQMRRFVADASHELRTPLTAITGFLELMSQGELSPEEHERGLAAIREQGRRMGRLVNQLLTLSRMDSAPKTHVAVVPLRLDQWIHDLMPEIHNLTAPRSVHIAADPVSVLADRDRLTEVLVNLLDNIQRYTPQDAKVTITIAKRGGQALLQVTDTGPGISSEDLPLVFNRFYRGDRARTSKSGGSGLGLSIAQSIIEAQNGSIQVKPNKPHGCRFVVSLPALRP